MDSIYFNTFKVGERAKITDCNICPYLSITEDAQRELPKGSRIPHWCTKYDKQVFHGGNKMMLGYDPYLIRPLNECEVTIEVKNEKVGVWRLL